MKGSVAVQSIYNAPGIYRIRVAGRLDVRWAERLGGLDVNALVEGDVPVAELTGYLPDQAALYGVLNTLYDYRYPLLNVEYLGAAEEQAATGAELPGEELAG
jgi:hypothetical protein